MDQKLIDGVEMKLGRETYTVPALTFKQLRKFDSQIKLLQTIGVTGEITDEQCDAVTDIVHAAMMRNYPNMPRQEVEDFLDLSVQGKLIRAVMGQAPAAS